MKQNNEYRYRLRLKKPDGKWHTIAVGVNKAALEKLVIDNFDKRQYQIIDTWEGDKHDN